MTFADFWAMRRWAKPIRDKWAWMDSFPLSVRAENVIKYAHFRPLRLYRKTRRTYEKIFANQPVKPLKSWEEVSKIAAVDWLRLPNCGIGTVAELIVAVESHGLRFPDHDEIRQHPRIKEIFKKWAKMEQQILAKTSHMRI